MRLFIEPAEPLLFRTGRSFDAGESSFAETMFPPTPETLQGAVRATIATYWDTSISPEEAFLNPRLTSLIGSRGSGYGRFRIIGLSLGRRKDDKTVERIFKAPAHFITVEGHNTLLKPQEMHHEVKNSDLVEIKYILSPIEDLKGKRESFDDWLTESGLEKILRYDLHLTQSERIREDEICKREARLGISMDNTSKTTMDGYLYQTQVIRMQPGYGFVIDIHLRDPASIQGTAYLESLLDDDQTRQELDFLPDNGWLLLGGERRTARFQILPSSTRGIEQKKQGKLLYLATPAALNDGWQPGKLTVSPITAAIERYQSIGGWELDPANNRGSNKIMRRCVPAGSVYFFQEAVDVAQPLTDHGMEIGYGITYAGEWQL